MNGWEREPEYGGQPVGQWEPVAIAAMILVAIAIIGLISIL